MESLTYAVFFGLLVALAALEFVVALRAEGASRGRRWPANFTLTALNILVLSAIQLTALAATDLARINQWGLFNRIDPPFAVALVAGFLARSLVAWGIHYAFHNVPLPWRVHRVHHTDTHLDVSTTVRFHPLEFLVSAPLTVATVIAFGISPVVVMLFELFDAALAVFGHANVRIPRRLDRLLGAVVVTPDIHRIHHSTFESETNSNYGATLTVWDRLFGTFRRKPPEELGKMPLGLAEVGERRASSLPYLVVLPLVGLAIHPDRAAESEPAKRA